jgi:hypothetical protein
MKFTNSAPWTMEGWLDFLISIGSFLKNKKLGNPLHLDGYPTFVDKGLSLGHNFRMS